MAATMENAIYWIEIEKLVPNPYQPRREFEEVALNELADSIRQYGILQPLVVSRFEQDSEDGGMEVVYQLIAGERRMRASRLAGLSQVPCIIRIGDDNRDKLELAIIENVVRADLNAVERAMAYQRLADEFKMNWTEIGKKVSKSREYVSNTVRILMLPQDILDGLSKGKITEGHTRPLLMLIDRPDEMMTLFKEMLIRKMTVREAEKIARKIAFEKTRKKSTMMTPEVVDMEEVIASALGTRVTIDPKERGGKITIEYFTHDELMSLSRLLRSAGENKTHKGMFDIIREDNNNNAIGGYNPENISVAELVNDITPSVETDNILISTDINNISISSDMQNVSASIEVENILPSVEVQDMLPVEYDANESALAVNDMTKDEEREIQNSQDDDLYNINKFTL